MGLIVDPFNGLGEFNKCKLLVDRVRDGGVGWTHGSFKGWMTLGLRLSNELWRLGFDLSGVNSGGGGFGGGGASKWW